MNKLDFLRKLDKELSLLDKEERKEILAFYEERFYSGTIYENKTELEVIGELEEPEVIARNVLEEYGVSPKFVKTKEERYTNISTARVIWLIIFDVLIASWLLPTLYGTVVSIFGTLVSYIGVFGLLFGQTTTMDTMVFWFATGAYILILLFGLLVLELSIWVTKKILIYHLNVFKFKNREKVVKRLNKISVDEWFKKHKLLNMIKSVSFIGAIVVMGYTGFYLFTGDENVFDVYGNQPQLTEVNQEDLTQDIIDGESWQIITDFESMQVDIHPITGDEIIITRTYIEDNDYEIVVDVDTNTITISNNVETSYTIFNLEQIFALLNGGERIVIEVPEALLLGDIDIKSYNGQVDIRNINAESISVEVLNGRITLDGLTVEGNIDLSTSNGDVVVKNIIGQYDLDVVTSNGSITLANMEFLNYDLNTSNGSINADNLNVLNQEGVTFDADTSNGKIIMNDVYIDKIYLDTSNGDIEFYNTDTDFLPSVFEKDTSVGDINTNVR